MPGKIDRLIADAHELEKELTAAKDKLAAAQGANVVAKAEDVAGVKVLVAVLEGMDAKSLRTTMDDLKNKLGSAVILLAVAGDKIQFCAAAAVAGGKGGGKPDMAMAGAADVAKLADAMKAARTFIGEKLA